MEVRVKLMGALKARSPEGGILMLPEGASAADALAALDIAAPQVQVVMVNGRPQPDRTRPLSAGDELTVLPPVGGG